MVPWSCLLCAVGGKSNNTAHADALETQSYQSALPIDSHENGKRREKADLMMHSFQTEKALRPETRQQHYEDDAADDAFTSRIEIRVDPSNSSSVEETEDERRIRQIVTEELFHDSPTVIVRGMQTLATYCFSSIDMSVQKKRRARRLQQAIFQSGGHLMIIKAMQRYRDHPGIQVRGCAVLGNMSSGDCMAASAVVGMGGMKAILAAMENFPEDEIMQFQGCGALDNIVTAKDTVKAMTELEGISIVLRAMERFRRNERIQIRGCSVLHSCTMWDAYLDTLRNQKAARILFAALENHSSCQAIRLRARPALKRLLDL